MHAEGINALLVAIPLVVILAVWIFRVDEDLFTSNAPGKDSDRRRRFAVTEENGEVLLTDPDGQTFPAKPK